MELPKIGRKRSREQETNQAGTGSSKPTTKKQAERLASVVRESVMGSAFEAMAGAPEFSLPRLEGHNKPIYAVLALPTASAEFGGLHQKVARSNADKGQIIELIKDDSIQTVVTEGMLARDVLGIIPTQETLRRMQEFRLLTDASYFWCAVTSTPTIEDEEAASVVPIKGVTTDWATAQAVSDGETEILSVLPSTWRFDVAKVLNRALGLQLPEQAPADEGPLEAEQEVAGSSEQTVEMQTVKSESEPSQNRSSFQRPDVDTAASPQAPQTPNPAPQQAQAAPQQTPNPAPQQQAPQSAPRQAQAAPQQQTPQQQVRQSPQQVPRQVSRPEPQVLPDVTRKDIEDTVVRSVLREELDLKIDSRPFDQTFRMADLQVRLPHDPQMSGWLGDHLRNLSEQGNARLAELRRANLERLYTNYVQMLGRHSEQVVADVSTENKGSYFANLMTIAHADYDELVAGRDSAVRELEAGIRERFDAEAEQRGESARQQAIAQWRDVNSGRLERQLIEAGVEVDRQTSDSLADSERIILDLRRRTAHLRMDIGVTKVLDVLVAERERQLAEENALLEELSEQMRQVLVENREADIQRVRALEDELGRDTSVKKVTEEYEASLRRLAQENEVTRQRSEEALIEARKSHEHELASLSATMEQRLTDQRSATEEAYAQVKGSKDAFDQTLAQLKQSHEEEVARLKEKNENVSEAMRLQQEDREATDRMRTWMTVGGSVLGVLTGALGGMAIMSTWTTFPF